MADAADASNPSAAYHLMTKINIFHCGADHAQEEDKHAGHVFDDLDPDLSRVLVIGRAGIGKTSAMKGELVNGDVKNATGARSGAEAGTTKVEAPEKVKIW